MIAAIFFTFIVWFSYKMTRTFFGEKAANLSLIVKLPILIIIDLILLENSGDQSQGLAVLIFSIIYGILYIGVIVFISIISLLKKTDWNDANSIFDTAKTLFGDSNSGSSFLNKNSSDGYFVIQYRSSGSWIDGSGSNDENIACRMFDNFLDNDPRSSKRCRLVKKVKGRVVSVLMTS